MCGRFIAGDSILSKIMNKSLFSSFVFSVPVFWFNWVNSGLRAQLRRLFNENSTLRTTDKRLNSIAQLPDPKRLPILGNLLQIDLHKLHSILDNWTDLNGEIYQFKIANKTVAAISDAALIQTLLRDRPQTYRRFRAIDQIGGELAANGASATVGGTLATAGSFYDAGIQVG
jgi:hypothetical protein